MKPRGKPLTSEAESSWRQEEKALRWSTMVKSRWRKLREKKNKRRTAQSHFRYQCSGNVEMSALTIFSQWFEDYWETEKLDSPLLDPSQHFAFLCTKNQKPAGSVKHTRAESNALKKHKVQYLWISNWTPPCTKNSWVISSDSVITESRGSFFREFVISESWKTNSATRQHVRGSLSSGLRGQTGQHVVDEKQTLRIHWRPFVHQHPLCRLMCVFKIHCNLT